MIKVILAEGADVISDEIEDFNEETLAAYFDADLDEIQVNRETEFLESAENITTGISHGKRVALYFDFDGEVSFLIEV